MKRGRSDVIAKLKASVTDFESKYYDKYLSKLPTGLPAGFDPRNHNVLGLPHHDELLRELVSWKTDLQRYSRRGDLRFDDVKSRLAELVDPTDVDRFTKEMWAVTVDVERTTL